MENICAYCDRKFKQRKHLYEHLRNIHNVNPQSIGASQKTNVKCNECGSVFTTHGQLREHLTLEHGHNIYKQMFNFEKKEDFLSWKTKMEKDLQSSYVQHTGCKKLVTGETKRYYNCHRSGYISDVKKRAMSVLPRDRLLKRQGYSKLEFSCHSTLECTEKDGKYSVVLFLPHIGHECSLRHINLTKQERTDIAANIAKGIPFDRILDDIRNGLTSEPLQRIHLTDRKDLNNISRLFGLEKHVQFHQEDATSVDTLVRSMQYGSDTSPVLYYKPQEIEDLILGIGDFALVLMTSFQLDSLKSFGTGKICIDSTHGTNAYDFMLTTLLTVDNYGEGVPVAFLILNRTDTKVLEHFFQLIKNKVGAIHCNIFMSDDAAQFYNAWTNIMSESNHHLLCAWHVDRNWRNQLQKIKGNHELKAEVYKTLRTLLDTQNENDFLTLLDCVLENLLSSENTREFGEYFRDRYANRYEQWAYCSRKGLGLNTNMYLESVHKRLKHLYLEGNKAKRLDRTIAVLLRLVRDCMFKRLKKTVKGGSSFRIDMINTRHKNSTNINLDTITEVAKDTWKVHSSKDEKKQYIICKENNSVCESNDKRNCELFCQECNVCIHNFTCTCLDYFIGSNFCKHIHGVCKKLNFKVNRGTTSATDANLLSMLQEHNAYTNRTGTSSSRMQTKLDNIQALARSKIYPDHISLKCEKLLDSVLELLTSEGNRLVPNSNEPSNTKAEKQLRFYSTKRKISCTSSRSKITKPSPGEKESIIKRLASVHDDSSSE